MKIPALLFILLNTLFSGSSGQAQAPVPVLQPTPAVRKEFCSEALMYFNIPIFENPAVAYCEKDTVSKVKTRARANTVFFLKGPKKGPSNAKKEHFISSAPIVFLRAKVCLGLWAEPTVYVLVMEDVL